jgi:hypothetical protein
MGKKKTSEDKKQEIKARAFVLKVAMHCSCDGCIDKIRAAAKDITRLQGTSTTTTASSLQLVRSSCWQ